MLKVNIPSNIDSQTLLAINHVVLYSMNVLLLVGEIPVEFTKDDPEAYDYSDGCFKKDGKYFLDEVEEILVAADFDSLFDAVVCVRNQPTVIVICPETQDSIIHALNSTVSGNVQVGLNMSIPAGWEPVEHNGFLTYYPDNDIF